MSRFSRLAQLLLPPAYYIARDRFAARRSTTGDGAETSVGQAAIAAPQDQVILALASSGVDHLLSDGAATAALLREFAAKLTSEAGAVRVDDPLRHGHLLSTVVREGYDLLPAYFPPAVVEALSSRLQSDYDSQHPRLWKKRSYEPQGEVERFHVSISDYPELDPFCSDPGLTSAAGDYLGTDIDRFTDVYLDVKTAPLSDDNNIVPHSDTCFKTLKMFMPLLDVTEENAPFVYYPRTHLLHEWRFLQDFLLYSSVNSAFFATFSFFPFAEMYRLAKILPEFVGERVVVPARAGDIVVGDIRGVHAGTYLRSGLRFQLVANISRLPYRVKYDPLKAGIRNSVTFASG